MDIAPHLLLVTQLLIALLVLGAAALFITAHRKKLLALLVEKQSELIAQLRNTDRAEPGTRSEQSLAHLRAAIKWIQARYRRDFAYAGQLPRRVTTPAQLQQIEMAVAVQVLGKEVHAIREGLEPDATWDEIQDSLHKVLEPVCTAPAQQETRPDESAPESGADAQPRAIPNEQQAEPEGALREERARGGELERELETMRALYQQLLDEVGQQVAAVPEAKAVSEWLAARRDGLGLGRAPAATPVSTEAGELSRKALAASLQKSEAEMRNLRNALAGQHELVAKLKYKMSQQGQQDATRDSAATPAEWQALERMLQESDTCIKTLEMDLDETHAYAHKLEQEIAELTARLAAAPQSPVAAEAPREVKELIDTIKTMEDAADEQAREMAALRKALEQEKNLTFVLRDQLGMSEPVDGDGDAPVDATPEDPPAS